MAENNFGGKKWWTPLYQTLPNNNIFSSIMQRLLVSSSAEQESKDWGLAMGGKTGIFSPVYVLKMKQPT